MMDQINNIHIQKKFFILFQVLLKIIITRPKHTLSLLNLQEIVEKVAVEYGAKGEFLAALLRHLPQFLIDILEAKLKTGDACISKPAKSEYHIWTEGRDEIVVDISQYEQKKEQYLFWIDRNERKHNSPKFPKRSFGSKATDLLICLAGELGKRIPLERVLREVWNEELNKDFEIEKNHKCNIEQQITKLHKFCGGEFRKYLFPKKFTEGLGLKHSFKNKYFIFSRRS